MEGRTSNGTFAPGHRLSANLKRATGQKVGRPKTIAGKVKSALEIAQEAMPQIILDMLKDCQDESVPVGVRQDIREYLCDRIYGKANQPLSNADGSRLPTFAFIVPQGYAPQPGGLFGNSGTPDQKN